MRNEKKKQFYKEPNIETPAAAQIEAKTAASTDAQITAGVRYVRGTGVNGQAAYGIALPAITASTLPIVVVNVSAYAFALATDTPGTVYLNGAKGTNYGISIATTKAAICYPVDTTHWEVVVGDWTPATAIT